uniref:CTLH domain-containing protein n=1 Tax=Bionectria ochroleuca TaxID=29856 RepID=A0A8H7K342_BIOOC
MASHESSAIKHNDHLLLDQPLLRLPNELLRKNFRSAHFVIERDTSALKNLLKESATAAVSGRASQQDYAGEEARLHEHTAARIQHLDDLYGINTVEDVKYESWSRKRLDRLIADYFLRNGFHESAKQLAKERNMERLVDVETFESMGRIRLALLGGSVTEALAWCAENKKELRKMECKLEFMLRLQQYIELIRAGTQPKLVEAITHAKKHLIPYRSQHPREVAQACGLLALPPNSRNSEDCYADLYRPRWTELADLFTTTHNQLLSLPSVPLLHIALSSGLSALKTPACHASTTNQGVVPFAPTIRTTTAPRTTASAPSARQSSTTSPSMCPTPITPTATSSPTWSCSPPGRPAASSASSTRPRRPAFPRARSRTR